MTIAGRLQTDVKKMLPIWAVMVGGVLAAIFTVRQNAQSYLQAGIVERSHASAVAQVAYFAGVHDWRKLLESRGLSESGEVKLTGKPGDFKNDPLLLSARSKFETSLSIYPSQLDVHSKLAQLAYWNDEEGRAYYHLGMQDLQVGEKDQAEINFLRSMELSPGDHAAGLALAELLAAKGDWVGSEEVLQRLGTEVSESGPGLFLRGEYELNRSNAAEGFALLRKSLDKNPERVEFYQRYLNYVQLSPELLEHLEFLEKTLEGSQTVSTPPYHRIALLYLQKGEFEKARSVYLRILEFNQQHVGIYMELAQVEYELGNSERARQHLERALSMDYGQFLEQLKRQDLEDLRGIAPQTMVKE
ncbi:MAG: tetratricopeptide repeat protein [Candidatus Sumerlaeia bacterium]|nr:tetratricopeptide repeat protein [Candidatus Sumerlaeia bacterium]